MAQASGVTRRELLKSAALAGAGLVLSPWLERGWAAGDPARPNVLFVFSDQHQYRAMGCAGEDQIKTPNFDALAAQGARCTCISSSPLCMPYRASLVTGQYGSRTHVLLNNVKQFKLAGHQFLGAAFKNAGYQTGYIGKSHLPANPTAFGFDYWALTKEHHVYTKWDITTSDKKTLSGKGFQTDGDTGVALDFIRANKDKPFCLFLSWGPPHSPFKSPEKYNHYHNLKTAPNIPANKYAKDREQYYGLIEGCDENFGRLVKTLDELGLAENTIVVYSSDHGEMMGAHGDQKKRQPFRESSQVPLLVRWPGHIKPGTVLDAPIGTPDLLPTLAGLAGVPVPAGLDGLDRSGWVLGKTKPTGDEFVFMLLDEGRGTTRGAWRGIRTAQYNYARLKDGPFMLYDIKADPYEMKNLVKEKPELVKKFDDLTLECMKKYGDQWPTGTAAAGGDD